MLGQACPRRLVFTVCVRAGDVFALFHADRASTWLASYGTLTPGRIGNWSTTCAVRARRLRGPTAAAACLARAGSHALAIAIYGCMVGRPGRSAQRARACCAPGRGFRSGAGASSRHCRPVPAGCQELQGRPRGRGRQTEAGQVGAPPERNLSQRTSAENACGPSIQPLGAASSGI